MLGNGYKERLANAQTNIGSLLQNLSKQQQSTDSNPQNGASAVDQNEPALGSAFFQSKLMSVTGNSTNSAAPSLPPVPAPVLESNSSSRRQQQHPHQQQQIRTSRLPNAAFSLNRLFDGFPELNSPESNSSPLLHEPSFGFPPPIPLSVSRSPSRWDAHDGDHTPMSNSPRMEEQNFVPLPTTSSALSVVGAVKTGKGNQFPRLGDARLSIYVGCSHAVTTATITMVDAVVVIQRAIRRFLVQKRVRMDQSLLTSITTDLTTIKAHTTSTSKDTAANAFTHGTNIWSIGAPSSSSRRQSSPALAAGIIKSTATKVADMDTLQHTCIRQSAEINQLKELVTKMLLDSEEDRRKLRQRDREIEDLMKQQLKLTQSASLASGFDATAKNSATASRFSHLAVGGKAAAGPLLTMSSTVPSFSTFGIAGLDDSSSGSPSVGTVEAIAASSALGVFADDLYETNMSYASNVGGPASALHPLSMPSRSDSITSLQQQSNTTSHQPSLSLKINASQSYYQQQYQGLMDMVDSPSSSDFGSQEVSTPTGFGSGRVGVSQHGYGSQTSFPMLNHRSSGSFSSSRVGGGSTFDSPAVEQPGAYPWNVPSAVGLSHSQSWVDDINAGYGYDAQAAGQYQHGAIGHNAGFDPQYINPQYAHSNQQQLPSQSAQQQHQGLPPYRSNYRRHSDKPVHLDYQMCVDRILQATDQQASIHLQQKLKTSPPDQKLQIIDSILATQSAYPLMSNRFGNFLIQRCFEFGSPQQIDALAQAMRGNILTLACDPFGCHVVQKALDNVEEDCKARIVTEMFRRIRETIVHRYACHVWQKVFEIRWPDAFSPPAVMTYVNSACAGRWASVAVDETGSLVVQNVFENCAEHDKRPVLNEILQSVTTIAKGQWGNWVIQHILEHGSPTDRATVTQKILEDAVNLSLDQYASKVVEKTLRMAATLSTSATPATAAAASTTDSAATPTTPTPTGPPTVTINGTTTIHLSQEEVLSQYIQIVSTNTKDRPRIPLIDIAADQYGNYIIQYILTNAGPGHRETCAGLIRRHMVSLRGSKYGQKVAFMVERWRGSPFSNNSGGSNAGGALGQGGNGGGHGGSKSGSGASGIEGNGGGSGNGGGGGRRNRW